MSATNVVAADKRDVDPAIWTPQHHAIIRAAADDPGVERIIVNAAIKKAMCREAGHDRYWLRKVRPWYGHNYHFHIRIACPKDSPECKPQDPTPESDGCNDLAYWFQDKILNPPTTRSVGAEAGYHHGRTTDGLPAGVAGALNQLERARELPGRKPHDEQSDKQHQIACRNIAHDIRAERRRDHAANDQR